MKVAAVTEGAVIGAATGSGGGVVYGIGLSLFTVSFEGLNTTGLLGSYFIIGAPEAVFSDTVGVANFTIGTIV